MLESLIKKAEELRDNKVEKVFEIEIDRFKELGIEGNIKVIRPDSTIMCSFIERGKDSAYLLGECIVEPDLGNEELKKAFGAISKKDMVEKLFTKEEITDIDTLIGRVINKNRSASLIEKSVNDIKN